MDLKKRRRNLENVFILKISLGDFEYFSSKGMSAGISNRYFDEKKKSRERILLPLLLYPPVPPPHQPLQPIRVKECLGVSLHCK